MKKLLLALLLCTTSQLFAQEICPTPNQIKNNQLSEWHVFNINSGLPLTSSQLIEFEKGIQQFQLAEWMKDAPEGEAHCFYIQGNSEAYLAKSNLIPQKNLDFWHPVGYDDMQCQQSIRDCVFEQKE